MSLLLQWRFLPLYFFPLNRSCFSMSLYALAVLLKIGHLKTQPPLLVMADWLSAGAVFHWVSMLWALESASDEGLRWSQVFPEHASCLGLSMIFFYSFIYTDAFKCIHFWKSLTQAFASPRMSSVCLYL